MENNDNTIKNIDYLDETEVPMKKATKKKSKKTSSKKVVKKTKASSKKKSSKKTKRNTFKSDINFDEPLPRSFKNKKPEPETVGEELLKITNTKSIEQIKRPKKIAFMIGFYMILFIAAIVFCMIWFSKSNVEKKAEDFVYENTDDIYDDYMYEYDEETTEDIIESSIEDVTKETTIETTKKETQKKETTKKETLSSETTKKVTTQETTTKQTVKNKTTKETLKAVREVTTAAADNNTKKEIAASEKPMEMITNTRDKDAAYDFTKEIYSKATYYQYNFVELNNIKSKLEPMYKEIKDKVFGTDVNFDDKGKYGVIYLNYTNYQDFIAEKTDAKASAYDSLIPVERLSGDLAFSFPNAVDRGIYYDIPANNGQRSITMKILKGAKVGFTKDYKLTATLEVLDIECNTKLNTYFSIEDIVGYTPYYSGILPDSGFNLSEALKNKKFNYVIYDKKGYITDLMCVG